MSFKDKKVLYTSFEKIKRSIFVQCLVTAVLVTSTQLDSSLIQTKAML